MTAIGPNYKSELVQAILGPAHSPVIPDVLWSGWLDDEGDLVAMTGLSVSHDDWGPVEDGVANIAIIDGGVMPAVPVSRFALFDAEADGEVVIASAPVVFDGVPVEGDPLPAEPGAVVFLGGDAPVAP